MKTRTFVSILIIVLVVLVIAGSCATKKRMMKDSEELYGTWTNEEYKSTIPPFEKEVYNPDGTYESFRTEVAPWEKDVEILEGGWIRGTFGTFVIEDKWIDADTNVWYKVVNYDGNYRVFYLMKVSNSNNILEYMFSFIDYPVEIDTNNVQGKYAIYYRQE